VPSIKATFLKSSNQAIKDNFKTINFSGMSFYELHKLDLISAK